jgi:pimeloyl-ACP methyl ester carboxylesterase
LISNSRTGNTEAAARRHSPFPKRRYDAPVSKGLSTRAEAWRARGRRLSVRGIGVFWLEAGQGGTPLVLLHGFPTSSYDWYAVIDALAARRRVLTLDYPGFGFSDKPADYSYSLFEQAEAVAAVLAEAGVQRAHLLGHDMGTSVVTELLARRRVGLAGVDVDRVILMNGSVHAEMAVLTPAQRLLRRPVVGPLFARLASRRTYKLQLRRILRRPIAEEDLDDQFTLIRSGDGHLRLPRIIGYYDERIRFARRWVGALEALDRPLLLLWGRHDPVAVPAIAERLAVETGARLEWLDLGHYPQLEDPALVAARLNAFLDEGTGR